MAAFHERDEGGGLRYLRGFVDEDNAEVCASDDAQSCARACCEYYASLLDSLLRFLDKTRVVV